MPDYQEKIIDLSAAKDKAVIVEAGTPVDSVYVNGEIPAAVTALRIHIGARIGLLLRSFCGLELSRPERDGIFISTVGSLPATPSTPAAPVDPAPPNTGTGTVTGIVGKVGAPTETITLTCTVAALNGGTFSVVGSVSGPLGNAQVGVAFSSAVIDLLINDGGVDFIVGDNFTIAVTAGAAAGRISIVVGTGVYVQGP